MQLSLAAALLLALLVSADRNKRQIVFENPRLQYDCVTPNDQEGKCVRLMLCPSLRRIQRWNRLRPFVCGFEGAEPRVCCTAPEGEERTGTTRRPPTTRRVATTTRITTTTRRTTTTQRPRPENLEKPSILPERCGVSSNPLTRIVGGQEAVEGSWPWTVVVYVRRNGQLSPDCGGAMITNRHIITAAHCVVTGRGLVTHRPQDLEVRLGAHNLLNREPNAVDVGVEKIHSHEQFDIRTYRNDIAVLKLNRSVPFTEFIRPICLPYELRSQDLTGNRAFAVGWGSQQYNAPGSDVLMEVSFDIQSQELCRTAYRREVNITRVYMCAGTIDGSKDSCQGDSGGPLVTGGVNNRLYLVGIVSFGKECGKVDYPGVYTRVTEFLDWISRNLD